MSTRIPARGKPFASRGRAPRLPGAWLLGAALAAPAALGCGDVLGFGDYHEICGPESGAAPGGRIWMTRFGDADSQQAGGVAADRDGNALITGAFAGTLDAGGEPLESVDKKDAFILKLDPDGRHLWSKRLGGRGYQYGSRIAADSRGDVIVTGSFNGDIDFCGKVLKNDDEKDTDGSEVNDEGEEDVDKNIFVAKLDAAGNCLWSAAYGGSNDQVSGGLAVGGDDSIYLTGTFKGSLDFGGSCQSMKSEADSDIFFAAFSAKGECLWQSQLDFGGPDSGADISVAPSGEVWAVGSCTQGEVTPCDIASGLNVLLTNVSSGGPITWPFAGPGDQAGLGLSASGEGRVVLTGYLKNSIDFGLPFVFGGDLDGDAFLAGLEIDGDKLITGSGWSQRLGGTRHQRGNAVAVAGSSAVAVAGSYDGELDFPTGPLPTVPLPSGSQGPRSNAFVAALDYEGEPLWGRSFGDGESVTSAAAIAVDGEGNLIVAGDLGGSSSCGDDAAGGTLTAAGGGDIFIAKLRLR